MRGIVLLSAAAVAGWVLTPIVDMTIRGTIDDRTRAAMRRGHDDSAAPEVDLPGPRRSSENERAPVPRASV